MRYTVDILGSNVGSKKANEGIAAQEVVDLGEVM